ncbi:glutamate--tRNA ligase [bacterium]|nr:glutamate--tRNA ligase [bacterium]
MTVRVRFAPSPTGNLHIGTLRTALFNWLLAKHTNGVVAIRIEDTDLARSDAAYEENIFEGLRWLGLGMDEGPLEGGAFGPYRQSERNATGLYAQYGDRLLSMGQAYRCFCTDQDLDQERQAADHRKQPYVYSGKCKGLSDHEVRSKVDQGIPYTIKFSVPTGGDIHLSDIIRGDIVFDRQLIGDFVLIKSDGMPSYNFAVVVDDGLMNVTHVVRGEDHISNTPKQIMLFECLGFSTPQFAHLPMILGPDKSKLSKRHGATSVTDYKAQGILSDALFNYLVLLGWSSPDGQELLNRDEIISRFSLDRVSKSGAVFDIKKLKWMNGQYIRRLDSEVLQRHVMPFLPQSMQHGLSELGADRQRAAIYSIRDNLDFLTDAPEFLDVYVMGDAEFKLGVESSGITTSDLPTISQFLGCVETDTVFTSTSIDSALGSIILNSGLNKGKVFKPIRIAVSGKTSGPHLAEVIAILGKSVVIERLRWVLSRQSINGGM